MDKDSESVADAMNRGLFLAPDLIGEGEDDLLLEQAQENVEEDFDTAEAREQERKKHPGKA